MAPNSLLFSAVSSSTRQILLLLRCISFTKKAQVRISPEGLRVSTEEGSTMEAFVFLDKSLFTSFSYQLPPSSSLNDATQESPFFEINLISLLETLNIFGLSDPNSVKRPSDYDSFAAHRLNRHAGINTFANPTLGVTGICTFSHDGAGTPLSIHMSEAGVTTTCDLTTYGADSAEEIPFDRDHLALKAILRASALLDAVTELSMLNPTELTLAAWPTNAKNGSATAANFSLSATGPLGSAAVDFTTTTASDTPVLETFQCPAPVRASFKFALVKAAQRAMASATKVSVRVDDEGVLNMQFLVELEASASDGTDEVAFVDFRVVPLLDGDEGQDTDAGNDDHGTAWED